MSEHAIVVAHGADRPGVMDELSQLVMDCGADSLDTRTANLRGQFALLMLLRGEQPAIDRVRAGLGGLSQRGIIAELRPANASPEARADGFPFIFTARGSDQTGVLQRISHLLRALNVNIESLETHVNQSPGGGFEMKLELTVPRQTPTTMLRDYLTELCNQMKIVSDLKEA